LSIEEIFAPSDAVAYFERIAAHVFFDALTDLLDRADDFVAENSRTWVRPAPLVGMNVGRTGNSFRMNGVFGASYTAAFPVRIVSRTPVFTLIIHTAPYSTPLSAKSKMS
jgi:hypothetical protein